MSRDGRRGKATQIKVKSAYDGPEISVIVPAYNLEKEITRCLKSILAQKIDRLEIIVVNDCSTDGTEKAIRELANKHEQIRLISFPENRGVAAARNAALDVAKGEFIHFCDGDDAVPDGAYKELLHVARRENADLVTGNYSRMYPNEHNAVRVFSNYSSPTGKERCFESGNTMLWNKLYRRAVIEDNHIRYEESLKYYEDFLFFHRILLASRRISYTDMSVYIYTEPISRPFGGTIRYANIDCAMGLDCAWRSLAEADIEDSDLKLWIQAYRWNLSWYFNYSWRMIQDPDIREKTFQILRDLIIWMDANSQFGKWDNSERTNGFAELFHVDFAAFSAIELKDYLLQLAMTDNISPRVPLQREDLAMLSQEESDKQLVNSIIAQISDLENTYQTELANKRVWRDNYWSFLDSMVNDDWRLVMDRKAKEHLFVRIQQVTERLYKENVVCSIPDIDVLQRFKQVFCMDYATFQILTMSEYLMACSPRVIRIDQLDPAALNAGKTVYVQAEPIPTFLNACANGQVGMRAILRSVKAWLRYKLRRRK